MISLKDAKITDSLPEHLSEQPTVQAMSYAINRQMKKLLAYSDAAKVYAGIMKCNDAVLDILAFELQIPKYKDSYPLTTKRRMVLNGLVYWSRMGTVGAMEDLCSDIFSNATLTEWFDYDGEPGHFRITTDNIRITDDDVKEFHKVINTVKRLSAHLDEIELVMGPDAMRQTETFGISTFTEITLECGKIEVKYADAMRQTETLVVHPYIVEEINLECSGVVESRYSDALHHKNTNKIFLWNELNLEVEK